MKRTRRQGGFTFLETLLALSILFVALLYGIGLLVAQPRVVARLEANRQAMRALESTLEAVRAGAIPLADLELKDYYTRAGGNLPQGLKVEMRVTLDDTPDLYRVKLTASFDLYGATHFRQIETLVWSP